jgi:hypothetical protein
MSFSRDWLLTFRSIWACKKLITGLQEGMSLSSCWLLISRCIWTCQEANYWHTEGYETGYLFATMPGSSINSCGSWFIFNLQKTNTCYYTDNDIGHSEHICGIVYLATDDMRVLTMYILGLRSSWGISRIRPSWFPSGHVLTMALSPFRGARVRSHACPEEVVYSLNDSCSYFT